MNDIASVTVRDTVDFRLTGAHAEQPQPEPGRKSLTPALLAPYTRLAELRYDYPLVLATNGTVQALTDVIDALLLELAADGSEGERQRKHLLRLERELRSMVAEGKRGTFSELWEAGQRQLLKTCPRAEREALQACLSTARTRLTLDGELIDCDEAGPALLLQHLWSVTQGERRKAALEQIDTLVLKLSDMLRADALRSDGQTPDKLAESVGERFRESFDFDSLAGMLKRSCMAGLPEARRRRIAAALDVLKSQRFYGRGKGPHAFLFDSLSEALNALHDRVPEMVDLIKAMAIAELELGNRYRESRHDAFFRHFDAAALTAEDLDFFPSYLVCLRDLNAREQGELIDALASGLPIKALVQTGDILGAPARHDGQLDLGTRGSRLARLAAALGNTWVLQAAASHLYPCREPLRRGLESSGPALFSVYDAASAHAPQVPPYLNAAAAMQSRAFPTFAYDPEAGALAARFLETGNPQPACAWPQQTFSYEDAALKRTTLETVFTFVDFVALDTRYGHHFAPVPLAEWSDDMQPAQDCLDPGMSEALPFAWLMDQDDRAGRYLVDDKLLHAARRCQERWRVLQEYWGIDNSWAEQALAEERARRAETQAAETEARPFVDDAAEADPVVEPASETAEPEPAEAEPEAVSGVDPWIETPRCTTCDECTQRNDRMFAYDDNKQAYLADPDAGSFRDLVEAAENCQVSIIHPGKPRNPDEPGLEELLQRAEPFN